MRRFTYGVIMAAVLATALAACAQRPPAPQVEKFSDGELPVPEKYKSWPKFLSDVQRPDAKQVREIYINPIGNSTKMGDNFPNGTITVMEIYKAREAADGTPLKGADGKLVKGELQKIGVMGKGPGWGESVTPPELKNGDWVYSMYMADGKTKAPDDYATCRACHLPLTDKDYIFRYDEYFQKRAD
ncbi:cytochrome P460 family protein [Nitrosospira briensis]|uniref:Hemoglobin n=1 Tax=Nitrosospira briensis TaxID=35799 RepID=A0A1I5C037_9PROT|nr:cytochrome P460 family protein [Nitrosospira briensis]SFN80338.1 hemoglobin [Nitrosospira briensis]SFO14904.1 hemoglobin [Nitrosospira briensis]